ncbi:MAG: hypothetical protein FJW23_10935 [Acidimicrobiia bacterium]|nr:hypothetical protein [Acidimicrobiia bacterium]
MGRTLSTLNLVPLLVFPLLVYNVIVLTGLAPAGGVGPWMHDPVLSATLFSGDVWGVSFADLFTAASLLLLFVEIVKATRTDAAAITNHGLSVLLAVICIVQFIAMAGFATSAFFLLTLMTILDVVAGFTVTIVAAKRDFGSPAGLTGAN